LGEEEKKRGNVGEAGRAAVGRALAGILRGAPGTKRREEEEEEKERDGWLRGEPTGLHNSDMECLVVAVAEERGDLVAWLSAHGKYDQRGLEHARRGSVSRMCVILWVTQTQGGSARLALLLSSRPSHDRNRCALGPLLGTFHKMVKQVTVRPISNTDPLEQG
jgi:hypothetical protein